MKQWVVLLIAIVMIAPATGQVGAWADDAGDQSITYHPVDGDGTTTQEIPNEAGWYPNFDILRAGVYDETPETIQFELVLADEGFQGTEPDRPYAISYQLHFTYHDESMRVNMFWYPQWSDQPWSYVERLEGEYWQYLAWAETKAHPDEDAGWTMHLPKWDLRDQRLVPAREGDTLSGFYATASRSENDWGGPIPRVGGIQIFTGLCVDPTEPAFSGPSCGMRPRDEAGSADAPLGAYTLTQSPEGLGHILLETERPFRSSNGLATTYVYSMRLFNLDDEPDSVSLAAANIPAGWDIYLPQRVDLDAGEIKDIRMAVGVPFGHKHGEAASVDIMAKSERDSESTSETTLVVFWPEIAQPSGHHPRMYFHADGYRRWMNTANEDPEADGSGVVGAYDSRCTICIRSLENPEPTLHERGYYWYLYLRPGLFTGLDFETDKTIDGNLEIALDETLDTTVRTDLVLYREDLDPLIIGSQEQEVSFTSGEATPVSVSIPVAEVADRIPYEANSALYFIIDIFGDVEDPQELDPGFAANFFVNTNDMDYDGELYSTGSYLDLPLLDYHDDVDPGLLDSLTRLQLEAPEEIVRPVNPGKTAAYFFEVINKGETDDTVQWHVEGPKADWASVVPGTSKVDSEGKATVAIRVDVPEDAPSDDVADLLLVGQSVKDPEAQVFGNFQAYVETEADIPDESERFAELQGTAEETEAKDLPFPAAIVFVAVAMLAFLRRRKA